MTRIFYTLLIGTFGVVSPLLSHAQQQKSPQKSRPLTITGVLCDSVTHEAEAFATVRLLSRGHDGKVLRVATSKADGHFSITAPKVGNYVVEAVVLGMQPLRRDITLTVQAPSVVLDTLYLKEYSNTLGTATITAQRPLVRAEIDKISYSMADDPEAQTSSTLDMLRKVPMVTVDGEDNIQVNGNSSFKVYVNGKPNQMMSANPSIILKTYPASAIRKIEVITNPGAKYDAEGVAGVLNIVTAVQTKTSGYVLTPSVNYGNRGASGSLFGMAQFGKFMISAHYGVGNSNNATMYKESEREVFADPVNHLYKQSAASDGRHLYQYGNLDASYEFSPKDLLSMSAGLHASKRTGDEVGLTRMLADNGDFTYGYGSKQHSHTNYMGINASVDYQHTFKEDRNLTFSYRYNVSPSKTETDLRFGDAQQLPEYLILDDLKTEPDNLSFEHTGQVDYTTLFRKYHTLSFGLKYIYRINRSNNEEWSRTSGSERPYELDEQASLRYRHRGDIGAGYLEYNFKMKNWTLMAGSRYEYYRAKVTYPDGKRPSFTSDMGDWVPSISMGYNLSPTKMLKAGYNLRIGRPDISYLSPYEVRATPETVSYGNPDLGSTKAHNLNVTYSAFGPKFTLNTSVTYSFSDDGFVSYSFMKDGVQHTTYGNFLHSKQTTWSTYINWTIVKGTVFNMNSSVDYADYKSPKTDEHNSGFYATLWGGLRQDLPWKLKFGLWGGGNTEKVLLQGKSAGFYFFTCNLSRSFMKEDRLTLTLKAGNFFGRYHHFRNHTETEQFRFDSDNRVDFMRFGVGVRYRLGSLKAKVKKAERSIVNSDLMQHDEAGELDGEPKKEAQ